MTEVLDKNPAAARVVGGDANNGQFPEREQVAVVGVPANNTRSRSVYFARKLPSKITRKPRQTLKMPGLVWPGT